MNKYSLQKSNYYLKKTNYCLQENNNIKKIINLEELYGVTTNYNFKFNDENGKTINYLSVERDEQLLAEKYINSDSIVLELGARYGTVSCIINKKISNTKNQVSVEPDIRVHKCLEENMINNNCNFNILKGVISKVPIELTELDSGDGYGATFIKVIESSIKSYTLNDVETIYNLKFNTLFADCEGYLEHFFDENPELYQQLELIIFEMDYTNKCNYKKIINNLELNNFTCLNNEFHQVWKKL